jgi:hypothetical protein
MRVTPFPLCSITVFSRKWRVIEPSSLPSLKCLVSDTFLPKQLTESL